MMKVQLLTEPDPASVSARMLQLKNGENGVFLNGIMPYL